MNNIQIVQTCCKEKKGNVEELVHHMYILKIHVYGEILYQHFTKSRRSLSFVHDPLGFISPNHFVAIFGLHQTRERYVPNIILKLKLKIFIGMLAKLIANGHVQIYKYTEYGQ